MDDLAQIVDLKACEMATALEEHDSYLIRSDEGEGVPYWVISRLCTRCVFWDGEMNRGTAAGAASRNASHFKLRKKIEGWRLSVAEQPLGDGVLFGCKWLIYCAG